MKSLLDNAMSWLIAHQRRTFGRTYARVLEKIPVTADEAGREPASVRTPARADNRYRRVTRCMSVAVGIAAFFGAGLDRFSHADEAYDELKVKPELSVKGIANYRRGNDASASYDTIATTAELTFYSDARPYYGGLFVDYRYSSSTRYDDNLNLGAYFRYNLPDWDTTTWLFASQHSGSSATWLYATRLRYRVAESYKLGLEAMAPVNDAGAPNLMLGWYGSVSDSLSLNILAGADTGGSTDFAARVELSWQIR